MKYSQAFLAALARRGYAIDAAGMPVKLDEGTDRRELLRWDLNLAMVAPDTFRLALEEALFGKGRRAKQLRLVLDEVMTEVLGTSLFPKEER